MSQGNKEIEDAKLEDRRAETELVTVYETYESDVLPVIESILQSADIPFTVANESLMSLFPSDALSNTTLSDVGQVQFLVPADRAEEARTLLAEDFTFTEKPPELADGDD